VSEEQVGKVRRRRSRAEAEQLVAEYEASGRRIEIALGFEATTLQHLLRLLEPV
jgi:hypothetical protein